jgi:serine/threonine-protein phosphatase 2A regulatory subunit B
MLRQSFGDSVAAEEDDSITALKFDKTGKYLATGDRGGRIVVFNSERSSERDENGRWGPRKWQPFFQFQSHIAEFDYLRSVEIEEKVNQILFFPAMRDKLMLFSTSDSIVKLWKIYERDCFYTDSASSIQRGNRLTLPQRIEGGVMASTEMWASFRNAHSFNINSISLSSDHESFVSADDLRLAQWSLDRADMCFDLLDIKPDLLQQLTEVITGTQFHPHNNNQLAFSTSRGATRIMDTRSSTRFRGPVLNMYDVMNPAGNALSEAVSSIASMNHSPCGRYLVTRDFLYLRVWDLHMPSQPIARMCVNDRIRPSFLPLLQQLYSSDCVFDKFPAVFSGDSKRILTGSYSNQFSVWSKEGRRVLQTTLPGSGPDSVKSDSPVDPLMMEDASGKPLNDEMHLRTSAEWEMEGLAHPSAPSTSPGTSGVSPTSVAFDVESAMDEDGVDDADITYDNVDSALLNSLSNCSSSGQSTKKRVPSLRQPGCNRDDDKGRHGDLSQQPSAPVKVHQKVLYCDWHPYEDTVAIAGQAGVYFYGM